MHEKIRKQQQCDDIFVRSAHFSEKWQYKEGRILMCSEYSLTFLYKYDTLRIKRVNVIKCA